MRLISKPPTYAFNSNDTVAVFLTQDYEKVLENQLIPELRFVQEKTDISSFKGKSSESIFLPLKKYPNVIIAGLGKRNNISRETFRENAAVVAKICRKRNITKIHVVLPQINDFEELTIASCIAEGLTLGDYSYDRHKSLRDEEDSGFNGIESAFIYCYDTEKAAALLKNIDTITKNTKLCRDMINESSIVANPVAIAANAKKLAGGKHITCRIYGRKDIEKMNMGLLLAVSKGSSFPPQLVVLQYNGNPKTKKKIAVIGKGITYDSGGMNLKASSTLEFMRSDMSGAASCLYALKAAAELRLKLNVTAVIPLCENMISNNSFRAGDVYKAYNGRTVEIGNTDAEGRLILADALAFTEKIIKPDFMIDIATLTGACLVCFGEAIAALLSTDDDLSGKIFNAGEATGEKVWRLPFSREYDDMIKSDIADIKNVGQGRNAATIVGGTFLKKFVKDTPWAHIDIAGTSWYSKARGYVPKFATGYGVRLFVELFRNIDL